jgi:hypothetical protein
VKAKYEVEWIEVDGYGYHQARVNDVPIGSVMDHGNWYWCTSNSEDDYATDNMPGAKEWVVGKFHEWLEGLVG